ncbi:hypothetical protein Tco_0371505 [Tanacetum coccineum]
MKKVNFRTLVVAVGNEANLAISLDSVRKVNKRFANLVYGYFLGKRVAYLVVENYVQNAWNKYDLVRTIINLKAFSFSILVQRCVVWVKFHDIPITPFTDDGLSVIATKLADIELKVTLVFAVPKLVGDWYIFNTVRVEYKWKTPMCGVCRVFGHDDMTCPKRVIDEPKKQSVKNDDGFQHAPKRASRSFHMGEKGGNVVHVDKVDNSNPNVDIGLLGAKVEETCSKIGKNKEGDLADRESESDVEKDDNETACFMTSKSSKGTSSSKSVGGTRMKSLYEP